MLNRASDLPIQLSENDPTNALMYADDLIVLAKSQEELQEKIDKLSSFLQEKMLFINETKTKCMVFNRGYGTPMVAKFDSLFLVDAENIYSIYCKFYSII